MFEVGKGDKVRFLHNKWCGDRSLKDDFPHLFECSRDREVFIDSLFSHSNGVELTYLSVLGTVRFSLILYFLALMGWRQGSGNFSL